MSSSSLKRCHDDLQQGAVLAQHTFLASDRLLADEVKRRIIALTGDSLRSAARRLGANETNALVQLPPAVFGRILGEIQRTCDLAAVSQSCRRLRLRMHDCPEYWNRPTILSPETNLTFARFIIQRSHPTPLDLSVCFHALGESHGRTETCCQLVKDNMDRLCRLELALERPLGTWRNDEWGQLYVSPGSESLAKVQREAGEAWSLVRDLLETPAPLLRELTLRRDVVGARGQHVLPADLFCGEAPLLHSCTLDGILLPSQRIKALANLVSLHYHSFQLLPAELNLGSFGRILDELPLLEELVLRGHWFSLGDDVEAHSSTSRLRNVRMLDVPFPFDLLSTPNVGPQPAELPRVHEFFNKRGAWHFECVCVGGGLQHAFTAPDTLLQTYPRIESMFNMLPHLEFHSGATTVVVLRPFWDLEHFTTTVDVYANLEHLTIHEYFWPKDDVHPEAPRLETLCIVLGSLSEVEVFHRAWGTQTCSLFQVDEAWTCPALRSLVFAYPPPRARRRSPSKRPVDWEDHPTHSVFKYARADGDTLPVSLRDIHHFIARCLRFSRARLDVLELAGVEPVDPDAWALLYAVAEDVRISSTVDSALVDRIAWDWCMDN